MSKHPMVIDFLTGGTVEAMHRENVLDLGVLGPQEISRASDIRFDTETQSWGIWVADEGTYLPPVKAARGFHSYEVARGVEIAWFEDCRACGVRPHSQQGEIILDVVLTKELAQ